MAIKNLGYPIYALVLVLMLTACNKTPDSPDPKRPNILFAISDDQSYGHTSFEGCTFIDTPGFDQVAREGVYFFNCYAGSPGCAPSRSSIVTGRYHWQNEQSGQHASSWMKKHLSFIDLLDKNGYRTGRTGKGVGPFRYARNAKDSLFRATDAAGIEHSHIAYSPDNDERYADGISPTDYFANFKYFMENSPKGRPFFFWYGAKEPHRTYEQDSWKRHNKQLHDVEVPGFLPDNGLVRGDLLDYALEIEWFDLHLQRMLEYLREIGELENTIVVVTADNGMPFPRAKANGYDHGVHVPMAIRYPKKFPGGRTVKDPIGFVDLAPTFLELTETKTSGMLPFSGKSLVPLLAAEGEGQIDSSRAFILSGRERHSSSRYLNKGYPQRIIKGGDFLYIWNMEPELWPAGAPQRFHPQDSTRLMPMFGLDGQGDYIPDAAFMDIDDCPTKTFLIENHKDDNIQYYFELAVGKRPEFELFNVKKDPDCLYNLAGKAPYHAIEQKLKEQLLGELKRTKDPRVSGPNREVFNSYRRYSPIRKYPNPKTSKQPNI